MEVPPKLSGTSPLVPWLNRLREATQSALINSVVNGRYSRGPGGTQLICSAQSTPGTSSTDSIAQHFHIKSIQDDYLTCRTWDGTSEGGSDVYVAKPYEFRRSKTNEVIDGTTFTYTYFSTGTTENKQNNRTSSDGTNSQTECIYPRYSVYSAPSAGYIPLGTIFAIKPTGGTDVTVSGSPVLWVEVSPSRVWARRYTQ